MITLTQWRLRDVAGVARYCWRSGCCFSGGLFTPVKADRVQFASGDFTQQFLAFRQFG